jgi:hypothetical protein
VWHAFAAATRPALKEKDQINPVEKAGDSGGEQ